MSDIDSNMIDKKGKKAFGKLLVTKFTRVFVCSLLSILIPIYLLNLGYSLRFVGIVITLLILSNIPFNILLTLFIQRMGQRRVLTILSILMSISALLFLLDAENIVVVIVGACIGLMSANGTETGPFQSIEQAVISTIGHDKKRTSLFSWYNFIGYTAMSVGSLLTGLPNYLSSLGLTMRFGFYLYFIAGIVQIFIYSTMKSDFLPLDPTKSRPPIGDSLTKRTILKLSLLFSTDAFGGGFIVTSILSTWFYIKFDLALKDLGAIFAVAAVISAISIFLAPIIAKRIGLLKTMVFTHIPSNVFLILVPFMPTLGLTVLFLFLRQSVSQMDVPTRQSYVNAIIPKEDRASTAAITNSSRTIAQSISPPISTELINISFYTLPFLVGGSIKIIYDIVVYFVFRKVKPPEEQ